MEESRKNFGRNTEKLRRKYGRITGITALMRVVSLWKRKNRGKNRGVPRYLTLFKWYFKISVKSQRPFSSFILQEFEL